MLPPRAEAMAIRTDDIALGCFGQELLSILERGAALQGVERLLDRIPMVEVHLVAGESTTAIGARPFAKLSKERRGSVLATANSRDLALAIRRVIANVGGALVTPRGHAQL
jgi:hypothetical protein